MNPLRGKKVLIITPKSAKQKHEEREEMLARGFEALQTAEDKEAAELASLPAPAKLSDGVDEAQVRNFLRLSKQDMQMLNLIASGRPPRNAIAILSAIKLKLEHTVAKPSAIDEGNIKSKAVNVHVHVLAEKPAAQEAINVNGREVVQDVQVVRPEGEPVQARVPEAPAPPEPSVEVRVLDPGPVASDETRVLVQRPYTKF